MGSFKIHFDIREYNSDGWDIIPDIDDYLKNDVILNADDLVKGNIDFCVWKRQPEPTIIEGWFIEREVMRCLRTGVFIAIKDEIFWLPPNYYLMLQYGTAGGSAPEFRIKYLKKVYFKIHVRNCPLDIGTYIIKNRQDGETTGAMHDCLWESAIGNMDIGTIGMQSKTNDTVKHSCWRTLIMIWNGLPVWLKNAIYYDFVSGDKVAEKMKFIEQAVNGNAARDVLILFGPSVHNAFDSFNNMRRCILDEVNKWEECSFYDTFLNYKQFMAPGMTRKGVFDIFSSPADKDGKHNDEAKKFWDASNPEFLTLTGTTKTRVKRYYSDPLEGIEGMYDKWGDADPEAIRDFIMDTRANTEKDKLMGEIRANPLSEDEMFGSFDGGGIFSNHEGIKQRKIFLIGRRFKDDTTKEPVKVFGNLEWSNGVQDSSVVFRMADVETFDVVTARFCFSYLPDPKFQEKMYNPFKPPRYVENVVGVDPFGKRYALGRKSNGAIVNRKFLDVHGTGIINCPTMIYSNRPQHETTFYEDVIKSAVFNQARIQYESVTHGLGEYIEDRGYFAWLLPSKGEREGSKRTGDAPNGKGGFLNEGIALLNAATNLPLNEGDDYPLLRYWFGELLDDYGKFNPQDTLKTDLTMADLQALIGIVKLMYKLKAEPSKVNDMVMDYFFR